jgi:hypothetical protein
MTRFLPFAVLLATLWPASPAAAQYDPTYVRKANRPQSILASLKASGMPTLEGKWHYIAPFAHVGNDDVSYPPEKEIDLTKTYDGKGGKKIGWKEFKTFELGKVVNLAQFGSHNNAYFYLYHEFDSPTALKMPLSLGSDDQLAIWLNGKRIFRNDAARPAAPDQDQTMLDLKKGKNQLLVRVGNIGGDWAVYICPEFPKEMGGKVTNILNREFPAKATGSSGPQLAAEAVHYKIITLPVPEDIVMEVGGLAFRKDGKLLACTRRGDVWLVENPTAEDLDDVKFKLFATGLHEALGLLVEGDDIYLVQRPELTRLIDKDGDDVVDEYLTICDKWGVSGDYHEFAFGPAKDKDGNFYVTLNVGFGGGHQSKSPWRGWCLKISPDGNITPIATGLRSPNGVNTSPEGDLFYCDNQGEWVATNKMHHIREGEDYGHQAGLRWVTQSPLKDKIAPPPHVNGMRYDGLAGKNGVKGKVPFTPPCIWFPYDRMGQSITEPRWDTTGGKFGPFAGQCFVGDQTKSKIMRVALEKVNGRYQGACFPFRDGFQCGINRLAFSPDGKNLFAGETNRGWGSLGGKPHGLQRLEYTGVLPFEIHTMSLTKNGFDLTFTKPLDAKTAGKLEAYNLISFTYYYHPGYGCPEIDRRAEKITAVQVSPDRTKISLTIPDLAEGRIYELQLEGVQSTAGDPVLHPVGYYTLNHLRES